IRRAQHLPQTKTSYQAKNVDKWFNIIFVVEFGLIGMAGIVTNGIGHFDWFFPIMAIIVGVHFFPLAHLFQVRTYYLTGTLLCLLAIGTVIFVPGEISVGGHHIDAWWTLVGFGSMLILWITSLVILALGMNLLRVAQSQ